jgi:hypothetical protein
MPTIKKIANHISSRHKEGLILPKWTPKIILLVLMNYL